MRVLFAIAAINLVGCATATPVTPAPINSGELSRMEAALTGSYVVTARKLPSGEMRADNQIRWTFLPGNRLEWRATPLLATIVVSYRLEGRNMLSDGMFKSMRIDAWDDKTLTVFVYDISETYYCSKI